MRKRMCRLHDGAHDTARTAVYWACSNGYQQGLSEEILKCLEVMVQSITRKLNNRKGLGEISLTTSTFLAIH